MSIAIFFFSKIVQEFFDIFLWYLIRKIGIFFQFFKFNVITNSGKFFLLRRYKEHSTWFQKHSIYTLIEKFRRRLEESFKLTVYNN